MAKVKMKDKFDPKDRKMKKFSAMPKGFYLAEAVETDYSENKAKDGFNIFIKWEIKKGEFKGRNIFDYLAIENPSEQAVEIAKDKWSTIHTALGISKLVKDTEEIEKKKLYLELGVKIDKKTQDEQNVINYYHSVEDGKALEKGAGKKDKGKKDKSGDDNKAPWENGDKKKDKEKKSKKDKGKKKK